MRFLSAHGDFHNTFRFHAGRPFEGLMHHIITINNTSEAPKLFTLVAFTLMLFIMLLSILKSGVAQI